VLLRLTRRIGAPIRAHSLFNVVVVVVVSMLAPKPLI
jgi:membrane protease YdiL (CAAX protease family)